MQDAKPVCLKSDYREVVIFKQDLPMVMERKYKVLLAVGYQTVF